MAKEELKPDGRGEKDGGKENQQCSESDHCSADSGGAGRLLPSLSLKDHRAV